MKFFDWHDILRIVQRMESPELAAGADDYAREYLALTSLVLWLQIFLWKQPLPYTMFREERLHLNKLVGDAVESILPFGDWFEKITRHLDK